MGNGCDRIGVTSVHQNGYIFCAAACENFLVLHSLLLFPSPLHIHPRALGWAPSPPLCVGPLVQTWLGSLPPSRHTVGYFRKLQQPAAYNLLLFPFCPLPSTSKPPQPLYPSLSFTVIPLYLPLSSFCVAIWTAGAWTFSIWGS